MFKEILKRKLVIPISPNPQGSSCETIARQLDIALMKSGFKLSREALEYVASLHPVYANEIATNVIEAVSELIGDNVRHNVYFKRFPLGVPDTLDFWVTEIFRLFFTGKTKYGRYQHSYEEMLKLHDEYIPSVKDRVTVIHLGKTLLEECLDLYKSLAEARIPLNTYDRKVLADLADVCLYDEIPLNITIRENLAIINKVKMDYERYGDIYINDPNDVLRLACAMSDGDYTLQEKTKFKSFSRKARKALLTSLERVIANSPNKMEDVLKYQEEWKRLGEKLHPHEFKGGIAKTVFAIARGELETTTFSGKVETAFNKNDVSTVLSLLKNKPGILFRNVDRILTKFPGVENTLAELIKNNAPAVSSKVILSLIEHLRNREEELPKRIFLNKEGKAWVTDETRLPLDTFEIRKTLFQELAGRLPQYSNILCDPEMFDVALPYSNKGMDNGFNMLPRGSEFSLADIDTLRFFVYWKEKRQRTDYDLSAVGFDAKFQYAGHVSWTNLRDGSGDVVHSGDLTESRNGASEFIDINLRNARFNYIIPTLNIYAGENFNEVEECFFGYMNRNEINKGKPFEPRTVKIKSEVRGNGRVYLPFVILKAGSHWYIKWLNMYLNGMPNFNMIEKNLLTTALQAKTVIDRTYVNVFDMLNLYEGRGANIHEVFDDKMNYDLYIGLSAPDGLNKDCKVITPANLFELIV